MTQQLDRLITLTRQESVESTTTITEGASSHVYRWSAGLASQSGRWAAFDSNGAGIGNFLGLAAAAEIWLGRVDRGGDDTPEAWGTLTMGTGGRTATFNVDSVRVQEESGDPFNDFVPAAVVLTVSNPVIVAATNLTFQGNRDFTFNNPGSTSEVVTVTMQDVAHSLWARRRDERADDQIEYLLQDTARVAIRYATWTFRAAAGDVYPAVDETFTDDEGQEWTVKGKADLGRNYRVGLYCLAIG